MDISDLIILNKRFSIVNFIFDYKIIYINLFIFKLHKSFSNHDNLFVTKINFSIMVSLSIYILGKIRKVVFLTMLVYHYNLYSFSNIVRL